MAETQERPYHASIQTMEAGRMDIGCFGLKHFTISPSRPEESLRDYHLEIYSTDQLLRMAVDRVVDRRHDD
jgi:hypothetical protein